MIKELQPQLTHVAWAGISYVGPLVNEPSIAAEECVNCELVSAPPHPPEMHRFAFVALCDIGAGEECVCDYGTSQPRHVRVPCCVREP